MFLCISFLIGLGVGISVVISQLFGAGEYDSLKKALATTLIFAAGMTAAVTAAALALVRPILRWMNTPDEIMTDASDYLTVIFAGIVFMVLYNCYVACLRGIGDSKTPLYFLIVSSVINVILDLVFVIGLGWGVKGTAIATVMAQALAGALCAAYVVRNVPVLRLSLSDIAFDPAMFRSVVRISVPSAVQQSIISVGAVLVQSLVNTHGAAVMAAYTAAIKIDSFAMMPGMNIGNALSTFVGQNIGAGNRSRAREGLWTALRMQWLLGATVSAAVIALSRVLMLIFVKPWETEVIAIGSEYLITVGFFYVFMGTMQCFSGIFRGAGDMLKSMALSFVNLGARVAGAYLFDRLGWFGVRGIWYSIPLGWILSALLGVLWYKGGRWGYNAVSRKGMRVVCEEPDSPPEM
jgi:putative MATE family efflux protein